jgi:hypothetical protein
MLAKKRLFVNLMILILLGIAVIAYAYSCKSMNSNSISGPIPVNGDNPAIAGSSPPIYVTSTLESDVETGIGSIGVYHGMIDIPSLSGELIPVRNPQAIGDNHLVDITGYLNSSPCSNCFKMESVALNAQNELEVTFSLKHPFPMPVNNPPQFEDRFDLSVFDVESIFFFSEIDRPVSFPQVSANVFGPDAPETLEQDNSGFWASENWDGFTTHFDEYMDEFWPTASNLHPYVVFFEDPTHGNYDPVSWNGFTNLYHPSGHNVFPQGAGPEFQTINLGKPINQSIGFMVVISASFGKAGRLQGGQLGQLGNPRYFLPEFNRKEPWKVVVNIPEETDLLNTKDNTSSTKIDIDVYDWQHSYGTYSSNFNPLTSPLDTIKHESKVAGVYVEIPGVNNLDWATFPSSGSGIGDAPLHYSVTVFNDLEAERGRYTGLVAVVDQLNGVNLKNYGVERDGVTLFDLDSFVAYSVFHVDIIDREADGFNVGFQFSHYYEDKNYSGDGVNLDSITGSNIESFYDNLYIASSILNGPDGDGWDVYLFCSKDKGLTWEEPVLVNKDWSDGQVGDQLEPCLSVAPDTGYVYVAFTDQSKNRTDCHSKYQTYLRVSKDGGSAFAPGAVLINDNDKGSDQPVVKSDVDGVVWTACRRFDGDLPTESRYIMIYRSENSGLTFNSSRKFETGTKNYESPVILINPYGSSNAQNMVLIWRQPSNYLQDLWYVTTFDGGNHFSSETPLSDESLNQNASTPRAVMAADRTIYCVYKVNTSGFPSPMVKIAKGTLYGSYYLWYRSTAIYNPNYAIGDMTLSIGSSNLIYLAWSVLDKSNAAKKDVYVYSSPDGKTFSEFAHMQEPDSEAGNQEMPRFLSDQDGKIYLVYKDDSFRSAGDLFFTMGEG